MGLHFYHGGTEGAADGTLISSGDLSAPAIFDGMYPGTSSVSVTRKICIRADNGETWRDVNVQLKGNVNQRMRISVISKGCQGWVPSNPPGLFSLFLPQVSSVNIAFNVVASAVSTENNSPDTSVSLIAFGRMM